MKIGTKLVVCWACLGLGLVSSVAATSAEARNSNQEAARRETIKQREQEKKEAEAKAKELAEALEITQKDRDKLKKNLVQMTRQLQDEEQQLKRSSKDLRGLDRAVAKRAAALKLHDKELVAMIHAAIRLSQMPPEAAWMMPEFEAETMEAASVVSYMTASIFAKTETLRVEMAALKAEQQQAQELSGKVHTQKQLVLSQRAELQRAIQQKNAQASQLQAARREQEKRARALADEASNLKQLVASLEKSLSRTTSSPPDNRKRLAQAATNTGGVQGKIRSFVKAKGAIRPPSTGQIIQHFKERGNDEHSKGVMIETASGATVSAPYDAEVVFSGDFRRYGNMVILKHSDGFHTLISGLKTLGVSTGEKLVEGEPIGAMGGDKDSERLYVELRKDNQPINPSIWFKGL